MAAAQAGDSAAYQTLLRDCIPVIKSVARRRRVDADRIDDAVQDVLLTIHRARHTYDPSLVSVAKCVDSSKHGSVMPMNWA
jgi:RNA polymerase sigma-70 factor (ECF subfamily)